MTDAIQRKLQRYLTVGDLRAALDGLPDDAIPVFQSDYGDHSHTQQALPILGVEPLRDGYLYETAYSNSGIGIRDITENDDGAHEPDENVIVLV